MKNIYSFTIVKLFTLCFICCVFWGCPPSGYLEVDSQIIQEKIYDPSSIKYEGLQSSTVLYLDHSTCVIDARQNPNSVFNALRPQLGQYSDTLKLIKGNLIETIPLDRQENRIFEVLQTIQSDIPFTDILSAVDQICKDNQQAILITDCEFFRNALNHDQDPYFSEPFKIWLKKGHCIYIVVEPYKETYKGKVSDKNRFYFFFTDDRLNAPISDNMLKELNTLVNDSICKIFKISNSDIFVNRPADMIDSNLNFSVEVKNGFDFVAIDDKWNTIREYVMGLDKYGNPIPGSVPLPLIKNLEFKDMENYNIDDLGIVATNITEQYLSKDSNAAQNIKLDCNAIKPNNVDMSDGFVLDKNALEKNKINVMITDKVFNNLSGQYGGNLIRLDFVITRVSVKLYDSNIFEWQSLFSNGKAICVSKSIDNVLHDIDIYPMANDRKVIYTIFIKTEAYN